MHKCPMPCVGAEVSLLILLHSVPPHPHQYVQSRAPAVTSPKSFMSKPAIKFISIHVNKLEHELSRTYKMQTLWNKFFSR